MLYVYIGQNMVMGAVRQLVIGWVAMSEVSARECQLPMVLVACMSSASAGFRGLDMGNMRGELVLCCQEK